MKPSERILMEVAEKASPEYKKAKALRHFEAPVEHTIFDDTTFGQRDALNVLLDDTTECTDEPEEELDGVLDLRQ